MSQKNNTPITARMEQLQDMLAWFDGDDFILEEAVEKYQQAVALADGIERELDGLKNDIQVLKKKFDE